MSLEICPLPKDVADYRLKQFDHGVFTFELLKLKITPTVVNPYEEGVNEGTVYGTQMALAQMFTLIGEKYASLHDVLGTESSIPRLDTVEQKKKMYTWSIGPEFPPHCATIPRDHAWSKYRIFDFWGLNDVGSILKKITPLTFLDWHKTPKAQNLANISAYNQSQHVKKANAYKEGNVGDYPDWFSDATFGQQQFTGTNPTTITTIANDLELLAEFLIVAELQNNQKMVDLLKSIHASDLYVQDCRYFRDAIGEFTADIKNDTNAAKKGQFRYNCAAVCLFHLQPDGKLHPLAIVIDYKVSMKDSVVIFNKRLHAAPTGTTPKEEETDWPWRYAKTCAQVSDWIRHELGIHLTNTHLVEEAVIVATQRTFKWDNVILRLLYPHWYKTLSLNAAARDILVPEIILDLVGFSKEQALAFINYSYKQFDWTGKYVPNDLTKRGFPLDKLPEVGVGEAQKSKFRNYAYARNILPMWQMIRRFVRDMLTIQYKNDAAVAESIEIKQWCAEIRGPAQITSFPEEINTLRALVDAVTMCIHIASPQHTAVNYLQQFYQSFVINKPAALCAEPPKSIEALNKYTETDLMKALPIERPREWLLLSHLPWLLNFGVTEGKSLAGYVSSLYNVYKEKKPSKNDPHAVEISEAAKGFYSELQAFHDLVPLISAERHDNRYPYTVLYPDLTAVSILI
ncbi:lipoxygenase [Wilcoxina mikolae CBS 423.85]|nr:lipoxygenase [Wilcoxina mikolae CBS 423.85]